MRTFEPSNVGNSTARGVLTKEYAVLITVALPRFGFPGSAVGVTRGEDEKFPKSALGTADATGFLGFVNFDEGGMRDKRRCRLRA